MKSSILNFVSLGIVPLATLFSLYLLFRGHHEPGGGFIAGLVLGISIWLQAVAFGVPTTRSRLRGKIRPLILLGIGLALVSGLPALALGDAFFTHYHLQFQGIFISSALVFDLGVFFTVVGVVSVFLDTFAEVPA